MAPDAISVIVTRMRNTAHRHALFSLLLLAHLADAGEPAADDVVQQLARSHVSRLEWGIEKLKDGLGANFANDPLTLEPSEPRFFINVGYDAARVNIVIEIGRTFPSIEAVRARTACGEYIGRVRAFLSVDKLGQPSVGAASALAAEFFHPLGAATPPTVEFARALDAIVALRAIVASPTNGVYAICTAGLTGTPVRHVD
jgi:hypothetical protein